MTATVAAIQDRIIVLITAITPTQLESVAFRHTQDEGDGDFKTFAESAPAGAFRRFQVEDTGEDEPPEVSGVDQSETIATLRITVAYPYDKKAGANGARDRRALMDADWRLINYAVGAIGRGNFSSTHDCTPLGCVKTIEDGEACEYLVIDGRYSFYLDVDA